jgi:tetratricopeptide (TPR) repeat protein
MKEKIINTYKNGLKEFLAKNYIDAEKMFVETVKPALSKFSVYDQKLTIEECKEELLGAMYYLGKIYLSSAEFHNNYSKAAAIFQYCNAFAKKYDVVFNGENGDRIDFLNEAFSVEDQYLENSALVLTVYGSENYTQKKIEQYKQQLALLREEVKAKIEELNKLSIDQISLRSQEIQKLYEYCNDFFINNNDDGKPGLIQKLLQDCFKQMGELPPEYLYSFIGLGSLASGKMTPWSDLEFAILIHQDDDPYIKEYFRNLTKLLHIKIINFGETPLRSVGIESLNNFRSINSEDDWFWDDIIDNGFSFDGPHWYASKTPLGRQGGFKIKKNVLIDNIEKEVIVTLPDYELILTPEEMAAFQAEEKVNIVKDNQGFQQSNSWYETDKYLVQALRSVVLIEGNQLLLDLYREELWVALDPIPRKIRAIENLRDDMSDFSLKLGDEEEGKLLNVKRDIFRIGDRIIEDLANYYGVLPERGNPGITTWKIIDELLDKQIIIQDSAAQHLKNALSIAAELRLATYCHNKGQRESVSTYIPAVTHLDDKQKKQLLEQTFHIKDISILHYFYYVMIKLQKTVEAFYDDKYAYLKEYIINKYAIIFHDLIDQTNYTLGMVHARFLGYDKALKFMEAAKMEDPENIELLNNLQFLYVKTGSVEKAARLGEEILKLIESKENVGYDEADKAAVYNNLGGALINKGQYDAALQIFYKALSLIPKSDKGQQTPEMAHNYSNIGTVHMHRGEYDKALKNFEKALNILAEVYKDKPSHPDLATLYSNIGETKRHKGQFDEALENHYKALNIQIRAFKDNPNKNDISFTYLNIGEIFRGMKKYDKAIDYYNNALDILLKIHSTIPYHLDIAIIYNNLAICYGQKREFDKEEHFNRLALEIRLHVYSETPNHPEIATSYMDLGNVFIHKGNITEALSYHQRGHCIRQLAYDDFPYHPDIANSYYHLGGDYFVLGDFHSAYYNAGRAVKIFNMHPNGEHIGLAYRLYHMTLFQLGNEALLNIKGHKKKLPDPREFFGKIDESYNELNFYSEEFIKLQLKYVESAASYLALQATINCYKVLIKIDPFLSFGNYYFKLANAYRANREFKLANENYINAFVQKSHLVNADLLTEYSQFLIVNYDKLFNENIYINKVQITNNLYTVLECTNDCSVLNYSRLDKDFLCDVLKEIIGKKEGFSEVNPVILACYLLIKFSQYRNVKDDVSNLLQKLNFLCDMQLDNISYQILSDAYASCGQYKLANEFNEYSNLVIKLNSLILKADNSGDEVKNIDSLAIKDFALKLRMAGYHAVSQQNYKQAEKFFGKLMMIYKDIINDKTEFFNVISDSLTVMLLNNNHQLYAQLKIAFAAPLNLNLIKHAKEDVEEYVSLDTAFSIEFLVKGFLNIFQENMDHNVSNNIFGLEENFCLIGN